MSRLDARFSAPGPEIRLITACLAMLAVLLSLAAFASPVQAKNACPTSHSDAALVPDAPKAQVDQARSATLLFMPGPVRTPEPVLAADLEQLPGFSVGLFSPTLGRYSPTQMLLDISQGARVASSLYKPAAAPPPAMIVDSASGPARYRDWPSLITRAADVPGDVQPGLLGCAVLRSHKHIAWVGYAGSYTSTGIAAADSAGTIRRVEIPLQRDLANSIARLEHNFDVVIAALPPGGDGTGVIRRLAIEQPSRLLIVVQAPPDPARTRLLTIAVRGIGGQGGLKSGSTRRAGLVAATDVAPTILDRIGVPPPAAMQGQPIEAAPRTPAAQLNAMNDRLSLVAGRRAPLGRTAITLGGIVLILLLLLGRLTGRYEEVSRLCMRLVGLAVLWLPAMLLLTAWLRPSRATETDLAVVGSLLLAFATDRIVRWPRAPWVPVLAVLLLHGVDFAVLDSKLTGESLLGPNPLYGARFFGVGNELEAVLSVSALIGVGAALCDRGVRRPARWFAGAGVGLALFLGLGRLGADVGGVITVAAGFGVAALYVARMRFTPVRIAMLMLIPVLGLALIGGLDALSGGQSHLSRTVLHAHSAGDLLKVADRRVRASIEGAKTNRIWMLLIASIVLLAWGWLRRERLLARLEEDGVDPGGRRPFRAALVGGVAATVVGALANDSGPAILIIGTIYLVMGLLYARGRPTGPRSDLGSV